MLRDSNAFKSPMIIFLVMKYYQLSDPSYLREINRAFKRIRKLKILTGKDLILFNLKSDIFLLAN